MPRAKMLERADQADGDNRYAELLSHAEPAILEFVHVAVTGSFRLGKDN